MPDFPWYDYLELSTRALGVLRKAIPTGAKDEYRAPETLAEARAITKEQWERIPNCGRITRAEIMTALHTATEPHPSVAAPRLHEYESVLNVDGWPAVLRFRVSRGWLYVADKGAVGGMVFVPDVGR